MKNVLPRSWAKYLIQRNQELHEKYGEEYNEVDWTVISEIKKNKKKIILL